MDLITLSKAKEMLDELDGQCSDNMADEPVLRDIVTKIYKSIEANVDCKLEEVGHDYKDCGSLYGVLDTCCIKDIKSKSINQAISKNKDFITKLLN
jgi:hypothetical protein